MKIIIISLFIIIVLVIVSFYYLAIRSQSGKPPGLVSGQLTPCLNKPNCIVSEYGSDEKHYMEPIDIANAVKSQVVEKAKKVIQSIGGELQIEQHDYLAAKFTSRYFKFVDDFEVRIDTEQQILHIRSASREGYSDMGVNIKRVSLFKKHYSQIK